MKKQYLLGSFIVSALLIPVLASAATADEIKAQIQSLLSQITALQAQLNSLTSDTSTTISTSSNVCPNLYRALSRGSRGSDVISLQQFLLSTGDFTYPEITDYYGPATERAVQQWQARNDVVSSGNAASTGYGVVGPLTRAAIIARCGTKPPVVQSCPVYAACPSGYTTNTSTDANGCTKISCTPWQSTGSLNASPTSGAAPLLVEFTATVSAIYFGGVQIDFGDGSVGRTFKLENNYSGTASQVYGTGSYVYTSAGTYLAQLIGIGEGRNEVFATKTIKVSAAPVSCPVYNACPSGYTTSTAVDLNGCTTLKCTVTAQCPVYAACPSGYTTNTSTDANGCTRISCTNPGSLLWQTSSSAPLTVTFSGSSGQGSEGLASEIVVWIDFGDGTVDDSIGSDSFSRTHTYPSPGTYTAKLQWRTFGQESSNFPTNTVATVTITVGG